MPSDLPSGFEPRHLHENDTDVGVPETYPRVGLTKVAVSYLDDGATEQLWRLVLGDKIPDDPNEIAVMIEVWLTELQMSGLCDLKAEIDRRLSGGAF